MLDGHWAVNTRASILLAQAFSREHDDSRPGGRIVFMTSGQNRGPMPGVVAYAASKGALASITQTICARFEATHEIQLIESEVRSETVPQELEFATARQRAVLLSERPVGMRWAYLRPRLQPS